MTKAELIAQLKADYPTLSYGVNDEVFVMSKDEYEKTITEWAEARIKKEEEKQEQIAKKNALLTKLGITEDEARLLLA